ncbi:MAG: response regulator transcription factor [Chryseobacterium sp.]|nr:MAG: response regulator transcription factor [Chryseobacterium sp.]
MMTTKLKCVAVDDQTHELSVIQKLIRAHPDLILLKTYSSSLKALAGIKKNDNIDIVFMDVEMPELDGINLAKLIRANTRHLVFITAFEQYALKSFSASPDDYLLKPVSKLAFVECISKVISRSAQPLQSYSEIDDDLFIPTEIKGISARVRRADIVMFEPLTGTNYTKIYTEEKVHEMHVTLNAIEQYLQQDSRFMRISRSCIINLKHIVTLSAGKVIMGPMKKKMSIGADYAEIFHAYLSDRLLGKLG